MKRTVKQTTIEVPGWFRLFLASLCLAGFGGAGRYVSTTFDGTFDAQDESEFSVEAPALYLRSSLAFNDGSAYLDGRGRRFGDGVPIDDPMLLTASQHTTAEIPRTSTSRNELVSTEQPAEFVDEPEEAFAVDSPVLQDKFGEYDDNVYGGKVPSLADFEAPDLTAPGWRNDELDCDVKDLSAEWAEFDVAEKAKSSALGGVDFVDQFDKSLVTDDLFDVNATTLFIGQTSAEQDDAQASATSEKKGGISQVSAVAPVQPARSGRFIPLGAVGGSGDVVVPIK